ncbi:MAG: DUF1810 domain-containing protein [Pseudomonadota bacterium]
MSLDRFVDAQADSYAQALAEVQAGQKVSHWMWFIWPQLRELGHSARAKYYGLADLDEAVAYRLHPVLGPRLVEISEAMLDHRGQSAEDVLGPVDAVKLRSSATLFEVAATDPVFPAIVDAFYDGVRDPLTLNALAG